jgi:hypothetical protein
VIAAQVMVQRNDSEPCAKNVYTRMKSAWHEQDRITTEKWRNNRTKHHKPLPNDDADRDDRNPEAVQDIDVEERMTEIRSVLGSECSTTNG